jgi:hypothetical protein
MPSIAQPTTSGLTAARNLLARVRRRGNYYMVPSSWVSAVGARAALLLSRILTTAQVHASADVKVQLTDAYVGRGLGYSVVLTEKCLGRLKDAELLEVDGRGNRRWVHVRTERVGLM